jgi:hypothetical protein
MNQTARDFLARCFAPGSTIALLLRTESPTKTQQRLVRLEQALAPRYLGWLAHENASGANVYVAANALRSGSRKRTKESIASIRHVYLDIDEDGDARLAALRASDAVPPASAILSTSPSKYQVFWRVEGFDFEQQELTLKRLAIAFGGDPACTDCNRVLRIPGFLNRKYSPAHSVTVEYGPLQPWEPTDFQLESLVDVPIQSRGHSPRKSVQKETRSENDWAFVCAQLANGKDAGKLTDELAARRSDKPNPLYYAQRTVDVASARQLLLEGVPIDGVITMLHDRRRFDLPAALCSARSREIAATAQRMIARQEIA